MGNLSKDMPARTSRIPDAERQALLDRLDKADAENPNKNRRGLPRVCFRKNDIVVRIHHPGGTSVASTVSTRNLSEGGLSFLYNGYLHAKTKVEIVMTRRLGGQDTIAGMVQHCALVHRSIHLIGVKFGNKIFPKLYLNPSDWAELGESSSAVDPKALAGNVLHVSDQEMERVLLGHFLKGTQIVLKTAGTIEEAKASLKFGIDCILLDLGGKDAESISALRQAGYVGPIAVLTAESEPAKIKAVQDAGAGAVIGKPYDAQGLLALLASWLSGGTNDSESIRSTLADQEAMQPLIKQYVDKLHLLAKDMRKKYDAGDLPGVRQHYLSIRGTGTSFGFALLSEIARDAVASLDEPRSAQERAMNLQRMEQACRRTKAA